MGSWNGTVLVDKADAAGTYYRRNRTYDPSTARFTQEDPIGLSGGINAYGFASGDPVNYQDPFGLCVWDLCIGEAYGTAVLAAGVATILTVAYIDLTHKYGSPSAWLSDHAGATHGKAPDQVTPGTKHVRGVYYPPDRENPEPYDAHYDEHGRQVGRTDWTDQPDPATHTNPHHHTREYGPGYGPKGKETRHEGPHPEDVGKKPHEQQ
jgi:RHS repeat-associated protein